MFNSIRHIWFHDTFEEGKVKRKPSGGEGGGQFSSTGSAAGGSETQGKKPKAGKSKAEKPKVSPKPKAPVKAQLYAKVQELGLEKGQAGKYKKASAQKLQALVAGAHGWKPSANLSLTGLTPLIAKADLADIKKVLALLSFASKEEIAAKAEKQKAAKAAEPKNEKSKPKLKSHVKKNTHASWQENQKEDELSSQLFSLTGEWINGATKTKEELLELIAVARSTVKKTSLSQIGAQVAKVLEMLDVKQAPSGTGSGSGSFSTPTGSVNWSANHATFQHKKALGIYTSNGYVKINAALRKGATLNDAIKKSIIYLDDLTKNAAYSGPVWRGVSAATATIYEKQGVFKRGTVFADPGFASYSKKEAFAKNWKSAGLVIQVSKGGKGLADIQPLSKAYGEAEVLMARDTKLRVVSYDPKKRYLDVEIVPEGEQVKAKIAAPAEKHAAAKAHLKKAGLQHDGAESEIPEEDREWMKTETGHQIPLRKRWEMDEGPVTVFKK